MQTQKKKKIKTSNNKIDSYFDRILFGLKGFSKVKQSTENTQ